MISLERPPDDTTHPSLFCLPFTFKFEKSLFLFVLSESTTYSIIHLLVLFIECLRFCFVSVIQSELDEIRELHSNQQIRHYSNQECPSGRPTLTYEDIRGAYFFKVLQAALLLEIL